jgi:hypothetical protein
VVELSAFFKDALRTSLMGLITGVIVALIMEQIMELTMLPTPSLTAIREKKPNTPIS